MGNRIGEYGAPEMIDRNGTLIVKYPTEMTAALHILNPDAPRFVDAPVGTMRLWCPGCHCLHPLDAFHRHAARPTGRQPYCKVCRKGRRKLGKHVKDMSADRWYRG